MRGSRESIQRYFRDGAETTARTIGELGRTTLTVQADIAQVSQIDRMFAKVSASFPRLDVLVNNAAVTGWSSLFETTEQTWDWVINTNLKGTFFCSLEAAKMMKWHDPSLKLVLCGSSNNSMPTYPEWDRVALETCWEHVDYHSIHYYAGNQDNDSASYLALAVELEEFVDTFGGLSFLYN